MPVSFLTYRQLVRGDSKSPRFDGCLASHLFAPRGVMLHDGLCGSPAIAFDVADRRATLVRQRQIRGELAASRRLNFSVAGSLCFIVSPWDKLLVIR